MDGIAMQAGWTCNILPGCYTRLAGDPLPNLMASTLGHTPPTDDLNECPGGEWSNFESKTDFNEGKGIF
jgi:hypothetical protein